MFTCGKARSVWNENWINTHLPLKKGKSNVTRFTSLHFVWHNWGGFSGSLKRRYARLRIQAHRLTSVIGTGWWRWKNLVGMCRAVPSHNPSAHRTICTEELTKKYYHTWVSSYIPKWNSTFCILKKEIIQKNISTTSSNVQTCNLKQLSICTIFTYSLPFLNTSVIKVQH